MPAAVAVVLRLPTSYRRSSGVSLTSVVDFGGDGRSGMDLALERVARQDGVCVAVAGEVDAYTAPKMLAELLAAIEQDPRVSVDLSAVTFMDSQGLASLLRARQQAERYGGTLRLERVSTRVLKLLQLTRMDSVFPDATAAADGAG